MNATDLQDRVSELWTLIHLLLDDAFCVLDLPSLLKRKDCGSPWRGRWNAPSLPGPSFGKTVSAAQILAARAHALYELADTPAAGPPRGGTRSPRTGIAQQEPECRQAAFI